MATKSIGRTVWYRYKSTSNGWAVAAVTTGRYEPAPLQVAVYQGTTFAALKHLGSGTATGTTAANASAAVVFPVTAGVTYSVQVDSAPQSGFPFKGRFLIGLDLLGTGGRLALFTDRPLVLPEASFGGGPFARVLAVNGFLKRRNSRRS